MAIKNICTEVNIDVDVDLEDFDTDELIAEIEARTDRFMIDNDDPQSISKAAKDNIYNLYRDFVDWKTFGLSDDSFEYKLKKFFEENLETMVA